MNALLLDRIHFAFTITFHYLFPQLTMGLALLMVVMKLIALRTGEERWNQASRFWAKIFAINFLLGVVTGIPMEFQFGTNWSEFARRTGGVIGQPLAMEGVFAFFLESTFLGLFLFGEKRLSRAAHFGAAFMVWLGSWISGFFIIVTDAWMQHPVAYHLLQNGTYEVSSFWGLLLNPWAWLQYAHNMCGAVVTASFVVAATGAFYLLEKSHEEFGRLFLKIGVIAGLISCIVQIFPTGDMHGRYVAKHQPAAIAGMEGLFQTQKGAPMVLIGQPDIDAQKIDNPLAVNDVLSFLIYGTTSAEVKGLNAFPRDQWPSALPLLYYSYHIMAGLGTWFLLLMAGAAFLLWRGKLYNARWMLWPILLSFPLPYVANTAGWMTAEIGRQPWLVYGLIRTSAGYSPHVSAGNTLFTLLGFLGMYSVLSILWIVLVYRFIQTGPAAAAVAAAFRGTAHPDSGVGEEITMGFVWFWIVAVMIAAYVVLDGFDLGVGILSPFLAQSDDDRRTLIRSIGPVWDGNEVWLLAGGGTLYFAFPLLYASSFSGFYLPLMIVLWLLIMRGASIELRMHIDHRRLAQLFRRPLLRGQRAARHLLWRCAGECDPRRSASVRTTTFSCRCGPTGASARTPGFWTGTPSSAAWWLWWRSRLMAPCGWF